MKKAILFFLLIGISNFSKAQLTASGFLTSAGFSYDTPTNTFYSLTPPIGPYSNPFVTDAGAHVYYRDPNNNGANGFYITDLIIRIGNYWYLGKKVFDTGGFSTTKHLYARTKVTRNSIDPPCIDIWENVSYNGTVVTPLGTYFTGTFSGATCDGSAFGTTMLPNMTSLSQLTTAGILSIASPTAGSIVYNTSCNCINMYNGVSWNCLGYSNMTTVSTSGYSISGFYNHIVYTGPVGIMTIPAAITCPNQEYYITNNGTGNLTLNIAFVTGSATTSAIVSQNTTVHLMSDGTNWIKI